MITSGGQNVQVSVPIARVTTPSVEHRVADGDGVLIGAQTDRPHGSRPADVVDDAVGGERLETGGEALADRLGTCQQPLLLEHVEVAQRRGARRGVPGVRVAVAQEEPLVGLQRTRVRADRRSRRRPAGSPT